MRVAFVLGTSGGGTGAHVAMLAAGLAARAEPAAVFGPARTGRDFRFSDTATFVPVEIADRPRPAQDLRTVTRLRRLLSSGGFDVVHAHGMRAGALTAIALRAQMPRTRLLSTRRHALRARRPALVVTVHNAPVAGGAVGAIYRALELIVARGADSVLCVSADLEARMRAAGARRVSAAVVPAPATGPAPSSASARAAAVSLARGPVVLAVGRLAVQKGLGTLIEAAAHWSDLEPRPQLMIVGEGPLEAELKAQAVSLSVPAEFAGRRTDVPALLASAAVFVLPSNWEGQALILQEALRAGVPIVATRTGGNPALTGEDAALLVLPGDPTQLADAVRAVLSDPALAGRLCKAALDRAQSLPDEDAAVSAALSEYRHVTGRQLPCECSYWPGVRMMPVIASPVKVRTRRPPRRGARAATGTTSSARESGRCRPRAEMRPADSPAPTGPAATPSVTTSPSTSVTTCRRPQPTARRPPG
ncbi:MAG TPA: glycosyltransferase family 4 protein [Streptosporangiaceae bacterium]|nr:glycosyltransferase family 4 protein [Streptosporangiaceae bacterium]